MERIKVLIADGQLLFAEALSDALGKDERLESIKEYPTSVSETLDMAVLLRPQVLLIDYWLPVEGGISATRSILSFTGSTRVLVLSSDYSPELIAEVLGSGAVGFLPKSFSVDRVAEAVVRAEAGDSPVFAEELNDIMDKMQKQLLAAHDAARPMMSLTSREVQVLGLLSVGHPIEEVAKQLRISKNTVNNHIQKILSKTGARSHSEAVAMAKRFGLIGPPHSAMPPPVEP